MEDIVDGSASEASDILRAKAGDKAAYGRLVDRYAGRLHAFAFRITRNTHDAEDVAQRAFIAVWTHFDRFDTSRPFRGWLFGIAYKDAVRLVARRKPSEDVTETLPGDDTDSPADAAQRRETPVWDLARRELSPLRYAMLRMHYDEELPLAEIARITGCSLVSVKVHLFRTRAILKKHLRPSAPKAVAAKPSPVLP